MYWKKLWNQRIYCHDLTGINVLSSFLIYCFSDFSIIRKQKQRWFHVLFQATNTKMSKHKELKICTCETSLIIHLYWYPCFLISSTFTIISLYNSNVSDKMLYSIKSNILCGSMYTTPMLLDSKISVIKTVGFYKLKIISLLMLPLLSYLFNQVWVVPLFCLMPAPVWHSCYYQGCLLLIFIKYCCNISSIFLAFRICYLTKGWYFLSQIFHIKEKTNLGSW